MKIIGLGNALVDILYTNTDESVIEALGLPKGSMQLIEAHSIPAITEAGKKLNSARMSGGSAANTIHGLAKLGTDTAYAGKVGNDALGTFYLSDLQKAGIDAMLLRSGTPTGVAYTFVTADAERTFATYLGAAVELEDIDLKSSVFRNCDLLHIEGYLVQNKKLIEKALSLARENDLLVSLDMASYNVVESNRDFLKSIIPNYVNILFANEEEARAYTLMGPSESLDLMAGEVDIAVVKTGEKGSIIKSGDEKHEIGILPVKVVDTTGAGDQYAAGFLHGYANNLPLGKCGRLGALLAGNVIENFGARIHDQKWKDILAEVGRIIS